MIRSRVVAHSAQWAAKCAMTPDTAGSTDPSSLKFGALWTNPRPSPSWLSLNVWRGRVVHPGVAEAVGEGWPRCRGALPEPRRAGCPGRHGPFRGSRHLPGRPGARPLHSWE